MAKKTAKASSPIDQRETFVSIQKNFADSAVSVEEKLKTLYLLQQADSKIDSIIQLRGELPAEVENLEQELVALNERAKKITDLIAGLNDSILSNKKDMVECEDQIAKYQAQLERISNSREFDSLQKEIENQGLLRQIAEKNIGDIKSEINARKAALDEIKDAIAVRKADLDAKKEELDGIAQATSDQEEHYRAARQKYASLIDERTLSAYDRIRSSVNNHLAVVSVYNGNSCGGCFNTIIPQRLVDIASGRKLIICEHCGRIIVNADPEEEA